MATNSSVQWRSGNSICRCCLSEGCYKDISTEYFWMGKREVYSEMLAETFDLCISFSKNGGPNSNSRLICEACISRLRDAAEFKRQVKDCEKTFVQLLEPGSSQDTTVGKEIKKELKLENLFSDDDDDDFLDDTNDFGDDDLDDEPLMKLASKTPKKEPPVQLKSVLSKGQIGLKRKAPAPVVQSKSTPPKKVKIEVKKVSATTSSAKNPEKPKKVDREMYCPKWNAEMIVKNTTAIPFRCPEALIILCIYCSKEFVPDKPSKFREHVIREHPDYRVVNAFQHVNSNNMCKVEITDLKCLLCSVKYESLSEIAEHLVESHKIHLTEKLAIQPYIFNEDYYMCGVCKYTSYSLKKMGLHLSEHFANIMCEDCGKSFVSKASLTRHKLVSHAEKKYCCQRCLESFDTLVARRDHISKSTQCWPYRCQECGDRLPSVSVKGEHLRSVHGINKICPKCGKEFKQGTCFTRHFIKEHTNNAHICTYCNMKFASKKEMKVHVTKHTKVKNFSCNDCGKLFSRMGSLRQHMWLHKEVKKFQCIPCKKNYNQRVCWKAHMFKVHPDVDIKSITIYKG